MSPPSTTPHCSQPTRHRRARRGFVWATALTLATTLVLTSPDDVLGTAPPGDIDPLASASSGGLPALDRALVRLSSHRRLLVIAAHPDDEDTTLLTAVARGQGGEAAYLSLSRGDGGQNLIGPEVGEGLGLLRSRELGAARKVDGARQYFSRAYDFGYTRSLDETLQRWPKEVLLEDAVRVVRRFKPQVLMSVFPPTSAAGHGQHQAAGWVAEQIFELAGDPGAFPQLLHEGLPPWRVDTFYRGAWWDPDAAAVETPTGVIEPWSGRSILQIALESRSQHRCQDMGSIQPLGDFNGRLQWVAGRGAPDQPLWSGTDTGLPAMAALLPTETLQVEVGEELVVIESLAQEARASLRPENMKPVTSALHAIVRRLEALHQRLVEGHSDGGSQHVAELLREKLWIAREALATSAQVLVDAATERELVVPGSTLEVRSMFWNAGEGQVDDLQVDLVGGPGWSITGSGDAEPLRSRWRVRVTDERLLQVKVPETAAPSVPYFLAQERNGDLYSWDGVPSEVRGEPFAPPVLRLRFRFQLDGTPMVLEREVVARQRDQARGEIRRPLRVVPPFEVTVDPALRVVSVAGEMPQPEPLRVQVASNVEGAQTVRLDVLTPDGWPRMEARGVEIGQSFGKAQVDIPWTLPDGLAPGRYGFTVRATDAEGNVYEAAYPLVDYEHIRPTPRPVAASTELVAADLRIPSLERIGYVRGASDPVPELLAAVGLPVEVLTEDDLATGDLGVYDVLVVGSRAYEIDPALVRANGRLLDYVRQGGLMIVQYQQYQFVRGEFAPYPLEIRRPHDRITDETAAVTLLDPEHPAFRVPNALHDGDWQGWVQERGLYFGGTWDDAYRPLMSMADPQGEAKTGGLLVAPYGEGTYVYTGLAFFRQLPAGIPGAYRLFANLLSLQHAP